MITMITMSEPDERTMSPRQTTDKQQAIMLMQRVAEFGVRSYITTSSFANVPILGKVYPGRNPQTQRCVMVRIIFYDPE